VTSLVCVPSPSSIHCTVTVTNTGPVPAVIPRSRSVVELGILLYGATVANCTPGAEPLGYNIGVLDSCATLPRVHTHLSAVGGDQTLAPMQNVTLDISAGLTAPAGWTADGRALYTGHDSRM
jgi:hypothetical protein